MVKDKKTVRTKLTEAEYWQWRTHVEEIKVRERDVKLLEYDYKQKRLAALGSKQDADITASMLNDKKDLAKQSQSEYNDYRMKLEKDLGVDFSNSVINEKMEVVKLP